MRKAPQKRGPSVKACVKRLTGITLSELEKLSTSDLKNILKVGSIFSVIMNQLQQRNALQTKPMFEAQYTEHSNAA